MRNRSLTEDALLGWTWKAYIDDTSNPNVLLHMPVTKVGENEFLSEILHIVLIFNSGHCACYGCCPAICSSIENCRA
jgi:hypothetical protein